MAWRHLTKNKKNGGCADIFAVVDSPEQGIEAMRQGAAYYLCGPAGWMKSTLSPPGFSPALLPAAGRASQALVPSAAGKRRPAGGEQDHEELSAGDHGCRAGTTHPVLLVVKPETGKRAFGADYPSPQPALHVPSSFLSAAGKSPQSGWMRFCSS